MKDSKMNFEELSFEEKVGTEGGVIPVVVIGAAKLLALAAAGAATATAAGFATYGLVRLIDNVCE
jgi:lactobin A/cerein 7B family class IIb bacteriocin